MTDLAIPLLSHDEARSLTNAVKHDAERLWRKLVELYDGGAHLALGYDSWGGYFETEFGGSDATAYRLLQSGRVMAQLPIGSSGPRNEGQARELVPLLNQPEQLRDAWAEVVELHPEPTAANVREAVQRRVLTVPISEELLAKQQRETLILHLDQCVRGLESTPSMARGECERLLRDGDGDPGPFAPSRFDKVAAYAAEFAKTLREAGVDG